MARSANVTHAQRDISYMIKWLAFAMGCCALVALAYFTTLPMEDVGQGRPRGPKLVELEAVQQKVLSDQIEALGTLRANEDVTIVAETQGLVEEILFKEGSEVAKGTLLLRLDDDEEAAQYASARAIAAEAEKQFERVKGLAARNNISQSRLDEELSALTTARANVQVAKARLNQRAIRAPFAGRLGLRQVSPGDLLQTGTVVTTLDDVSVLKLDFDVPERFLGSLAPDLIIQGQTSAYPDTIFEGRIDKIDTRVDAVTRTIDILAIIPNDTGLLKPGLSMTVDLFGPQRDALVVSEDAIISLEDRQYVFVDRDGLARRIEVTIGNRYNGFVEIKSGLSKDDRYVVKGLQGLADGQPLRAINSSPGPNQGKALEPTTLKVGPAS